MTDGEALFLLIGFTVGILTSFFLIFLVDYTAYRKLQKKMKKERENDK